MVNSFSRLASYITANFLDPARDHLLPAPCLLCGEPGNNAIAICPACQRDLPWLQDGCTRCALPLPAGAAGQICGECLREPPAFSRTIACWRYQPPLAQLIASFKYHHHLVNGHHLALIMARTIVSTYTKHPLPDLITPVPLHWRRQLQRGFNQSAVLAETVAQTIGVPCEPTLKRHRHTPSQQSLSAPQRRRNLRNTFNPRRSFHGERIALVDDVMTTGATAREISATLLRAGAGEVHVWCLARTPQPH